VRPSCAGEHSRASLTRIWAARNPAGFFITPPKPLTKADALAFVSTQKTQSAQDEGKTYVYTVEVSATAIKIKS
jgi:hypothetical protein